jgi:hypothetical protein
MTSNSTHVGYCPQSLVCLKYMFRKLDPLPSSDAILGHLRGASVGHFLLKTGPTELDLSPVLHLITEANPASERLCILNIPQTIVTDFYMTVLVLRQVSSCGVCGRKSGSRRGFLEVLWFLLPHLIVPNVSSLPCVVQGWYNGTVWGLNDSRNSDSPHHTKKYRFRSSCLKEQGTRNSLVRVVWAGLLTVTSRMTGRYCSRNHRQQI